MAMLQAMRALALRTPTGLLGPMFRAMGLDMDPEDLRRLQGMTPEEFNKQMQATARDREALDIKEKIARQWQDLSTQLERAGLTIGKILIEGLAPLAPVLERLSARFVEFAQQFMTEGNVQNAINKFAEWLDKLGDSLKDLESLIHFIVHPVATTKSELKSEIKDLAAGVHRNITGPLMKGAGQWMNRGYAIQLEHEAGLPRGFVPWLIGKESGWDPNITSSAGAMGLLQLMPGNVPKGMNPFDPETNLRLGVPLFAGYLKRYHGDMAEALAAWNWGPGKLDPLLAAHPRDWWSVPWTGRPGSGIPAQTRGLITSAAEAHWLNLQILNQTGGSAYVQGSALAGPVTP
jgi:hypothetical protein